MPNGLESPQLAGLNLLHDGKVRGTYNGLPGRDDLLLQFVSNRISIFNFILNALVPKKGEILAAMTVFWLTQVLKNFKSHLVAFGPDINEYLPKELQDNAELLRRALIIQRLELAPIEAIVRGYLTGSGWKSYEKTGQCYGHILPPDLWDGAKLPFPIFTPTEKSDDDPAIDHEKVVKLYGGVIERVALQTYMQAAEYALSHGIIIADDKEEETVDGIIGDEVLTPDSSRFWDRTEWEEAAKKKKSPPSWDKEFTRKWGKGEGIDNLDPTNPEHIAKVEALGLPAEVVRMTQQIYRAIFYRLTGMKLEKFQREVMGIADAKGPNVNVAVVIGSESDLWQCEFGLLELDKHQRFGRGEIDYNVISCHRNPNELRNFAEQENPDVVVAGAGMAAALPGIIKSLFASFGKAIPVIGVAFDSNPPNPRATLAAQLSIEELPGKPVILQPDGKAFTGKDGFNAACKLAIEADFKPEAIKEQKPAKLHEKLPIGMFRQS
ncbi:MAG: AIR carboxylase family protein [Candidatus Parcubacteria bacterium]|nr:AIR carboxylase family protein [Candidatus Parcubacteria bacterium]